MTGTRANLSSRPLNLRLQNVLARAGLSSRRGAITIIRTGQVRVNGKVVVEPGFRVQESDVVSVNGKVVPFRVKRKYFLLNKPRGYLCSRKDSFERPLVTQLLPDKMRKGVFPVGRLDFLSEGLILLTNDGDWAQLFIKPKYQVPKQYLVTLARPLDIENAKRFERGLEIDGVKYKAKKVEIINPHSLKITLTEGKNREIRKVMQKLGSKVERLVRTKIGPFEIDNLPQGSWRKLDDKEVKMCQELYGHND